MPFSDDEFLRGIEELRAEWFGPKDAIMGENWIGVIIKEITYNWPLIALTILAILGLVSNVDTQNICVAMIHTDEDACQYPPHGRPITSDTPSGSPRTSRCSPSQHRASHLD